MVKVDTLIERGVISKYCDVQILQVASIWSAVKFIKLSILTLFGAFLWQNRSLGRLSPEKVSY